MSTFGGGLITQLICPKPPAAAAAAQVSPEDDDCIDAPITAATTVAAAGATPGAEQESCGGGDGDAEEGFEMRERGEAFMCLSLEVKNMVGVEDALEKFTEKEIIEGYAWDDKVRLHDAGGGGCCCCCCRGMPDTAPDCSVLIVVADHSTYVLCFVATMVMVAAVTGLCCFGVLFCNVVLLHIYIYFSH